MFDRDKYITRGVAQTIPPEVQFLLWGLIEQARSRTTLDHLQIFKLKPVTVENVLLQQVVHEQEQPPYSNTVTFPCSSPVTSKVWAIDDVEHSTMLLPSEY